MQYAFYLFREHHFSPLEFAQLNRKEKALLIGFANKEMKDHKKAVSEMKRKNKKGRG